MTPLDWTHALCCSRLVPLLAAVLLLAAGCNDPTRGRQAISGKITLKGVPLDEGVIEFLPQGDSTADLATKASVLVKVGQYRIPKDKGLMPGRYKVILTAGDKNVPDLPPDAVPGPMKTSFSKERIPAQYNAKTTQFVEVIKDGPNQFDYAIP